MYKIRFSKTAIKNLKKIPRAQQKIIFEKIEEMEIAPENKTNIKKLKDSPYFRLRVGNYRVLFSKDDEIKIIDIVDVMHRQHIYKRR